jgi:hypothetical protein
MEVETEEGGSERMATRLVGKSRVEAREEKQKRKRSKEKQREETVTSGRSWEETRCGAMQAGNAAHRGPHYIGWELTCR